MKAGVTLLMTGFCVFHGQEEIQALNDIIEHPTIL